MSSILVVVEKVIMSSKDSNGDLAIAPMPKKQKVYKQNFNKAWEADPLFKELGFCG